MTQKLAGMTFLNCCTMTLSNCCDILFISSWQLFINSIKLCY